MQCIELKRLPDGTLFSAEDQPKVDEWIAGLRSGEFKQGRGALYRECNKTMCCMGVLEHVVNNVELIHLKYLGVPSEIQKKKEYHIPVKLRHGYAERLKAVWTITGMAETRAEPVTPDAWNDRLLMTFEQIADLLEGKRVKLKKEAAW